MRFADIGNARKQAVPPVRMQRKGRAARKNGSSPEAGLETCDTAAAAVPDVSQASKPA
jgi:hypothetical protein